MSLFGHDPFYFAHLKTYVSYFGKIFSNIRIQKFDPVTGEQVSIKRVPLNYSGRDKNLLRVDTKPDSPEGQACPPGFLTFPIIGFELTSMTYDPDRRLPMLVKVVRKNESDLDKLKRQYTPVAYDLNFSVYVMSKNIEEGNQIIEQILPWFGPSWTNTLNLIPEMEIEHDIPVILNSVNFEDRYEGELTERRNVFWQLDFTMLAYFYGPILNKPIVKISNTNFLIGNTTTADTNVMSVRVTPGLDANGDPTSNSSLSIPSANIAVDDNYGYIEVWVDQVDSNTA